MRARAMARHGCTRLPRSLPRGHIIGIAAAAGIQVRGQGQKRPIRCPFHEDRNPSAFVSENNVFYCSVCTPGGGWSAKRFSEALGQHWHPNRADAWQLDTRPLQRPREFTARHAQALWSAAFRRCWAQDPEGEDQAVFSFLAQRGLERARELNLVGVVGSGMDLHEAVSRWPRTGHQLIVPLYNELGTVANLQARAVRPAQRKVLFPKGSSARGTLFANEAALDLLRDRGSHNGTVVVGEGLTDFLALACHTSHAVVAIPGIGSARNGLGAWIGGLDVLLALDADTAGVEATQVAAQAAHGLGARRVQGVRWPHGAIDACEALETLGKAGFSEFLRECRS